MTKLMGMYGTDAGFVPPTAQELSNARISQTAFAAQPQPRLCRRRMCPSHTQVAVERKRRLVAERRRSHVSTLAGDQSHVEIKVQVGELKAGNFRPPHACIDHQAKDGVVSTLVKTLALCHLDERPQVAL